MQNMDECMTLLRCLNSDVQQMHGRYDFPVENTK